MTKRSLWQRLKHFKSRSLLVKDFLLIFSLAALISLSVTLGFYGYYGGLTIDAVSASNLNALGRVRDFIDLISKEAESLSIRISNDVEVKSFLKPRNLELTSSEAVTRFDNVQRVLTTSSITSSYYMGVELYSFHNDYLIDSKGIGTKLSRSKRPVPPLPPDKNIWVQVFQENYEDREYLAYFQKLFLRGETEPAGLIAVLIDMDTFSRQITNSASKHYEEIFLLDETNTVLYGTTPGSIGAQAGDVAFLAQYMKNPEADTLHLDGRELFVTEVPSAYKNWRCISFTAPENYYENENEYLQTLFIGSLAFSLIIAILGALWISSRVYQPIQLLLELVQEENPDGLSHKGRQSGELEIIITDILNNYEQNNRMKQQLLNKQIMLNRAQNIALQAQINPHFLYNTLENINWRVMAMTNGSNEVSEMIVMLSKLLRFYLKTEEAVISVRDEMDYAKLYMDILHLRFGDLYRVIWEVDEALCDAKIVKTTLQPLLENAVNHGVAKGEGDDFIRIQGYMTETCGVIKIINSGPALTPEQIAVINEELAKDMIRESSSIGMSNVNRRIKLHFGDAYGLFASRTQEGYTCIEITIPPAEEG